MAADTRPYKSKEQDGQGNEIILRDQQLVEQASQTTMASGEYFEIVDVDGRMAKIPKANMVDIVREALGSLLNGLTDQTTVTKVPSLNGNTLGASTVATLASVLGVHSYMSGSSSTVLADIYDNKRIVWASGVNTPSDAPWIMNAGDCLCIKMSNTDCIQIAWKSAGSFDGFYVNVFWNSDGGWKGWKKINVASI